jgi:exodeoxyribonuclease V gamma subunit
VFGTQLDPSTAIPYSIADLAARMTNELVEAFFQLLSVKDARFTVSQVLSVLELARVKERFDLSRSDLERIAGWIEDVNIRWGRDAQSRSAIGLPPMPANTWKQGLQRLLLGVAMPVEEQELFAGILPGGLIEGQDGQVLGKLLDFLEQLFRLSDLLQQPCRPAVWQQRLSEMLERFFLIDQDTERQAHMIRQALETLGRMDTVGTYDGELSVEIIESHLEKCFRYSPHAGFISGGVTFCAMLPMRSIPFQIVCLVGMNNEAIPRSQQALGFDLITRHPQTGDRSRRSDDKYLFLEAILSARRTLYISYVGQSVEDNSAIPPSVLLSELTDYLREGYEIDEKKMVVCHPLQAFSPRYFQDDGSELFSYSRENFEAVSSRGRRLAPGPFFSSPLEEPPPESRLVTLAQLCRFFQHPCRYLLQQRLSMRLEEPSADKQDHEPFRLDGLERYKMGQMLLAYRESGFDPADQYDAMKAAGNLPLGTVGETTFQDLKMEVENFAHRVESEMQAHRPRHRRVDLQIADFTISGNLTDLYPRGRIQFRFAPMKAGDILSAWIRHLCLGHPAEDRTPFHSILVSRDVTWYLSPVEQPETHLDDLLQIYWQGLRAPLHFFPALSLDYFRQVFEKRRKPADVMPALRKKWTGDEFSKGELGDPYVRLCFEGLDPLDDAFRQLAERIFRPVFAALENNP